MNEEMMKLLMQLMLQNQQTMTLLMKQMENPTQGTPIEVSDNGDIAKLQAEVAKLQAEVSALKTKQTEMEILINQQDQTIKQQAKQIEAFKKLKEIGDESQELIDRYEKSTGKTFEQETEKAEEEKKKREKLPRSGKEAHNIFSDLQESISDPAIKAEIRIYDSDDVFDVLEEADATGRSFEDVWNERRKGSSSNFAVPSSADEKRSDIQVSRNPMAMNYDDVLF